MKASSLEIREKVIALCQSGKSARQTAELLELKYASVAGIWRRYRRTLATETGGSEVCYLQSLSDNPGEFREDYVGNT